MNSKPKIWSINKLLGKNLIIPDYQRPYKWTDKNITEFIFDIQKSIEEKYGYTYARRAKLVWVMPSYDGRRQKPIDGIANAETNRYD